MIADMPSRVFGAVISILTILLTIVPCSVTGFAAADTIHGQILMEDGSPAAGIKVDILSSVVDKVYDEDITGFANYYAFSVVTDKNGEYEFTRPSPYCMVKVDVSTLPLETGIDSESVFLCPKDTPETFTIYKIDRVEYDSGLGLQVYGKNDKPILADFSFGDIRYSVEYNTDTSANVDGFFADVICAVKNADAVKISQTVNINGFIKELTDTEDLSEYSFVDKAGALHYKGLINETEQIIAYLYADQTHDLGDMECATSFYDEIFSYFYDGQSVSNFALYVINRTLSTVRTVAGFSD